MISSDYESEMAEQRSSAESQFWAVSEMSRGNAANILPIYVHSFERQPTNETDDVVSIRQRSEILRTLSSNFTVGDF
jgi:hypothetical protein